MNKNNINTYIPNTKTWEGISITKNAIKQILFLISLNTKNKGIRLSVKKSGCAGFRYTMTLVQNIELQNIKDKQDIVFSYENISIYIAMKDIKLLEGVKIDFVKNNINQIFKFENVKLKKFCGCGESFAIS